MHSPPFLNLKYSAFLQYYSDERTNQFPEERNNMPSKNRTLFLTDHCLTPHENIPSSAILCDRDKIIATGGASAFVREPGLEIIELKGAYAVPGFIDSHVHGAGGFDASRALVNDNSLMNRMSVELASHGVTTFFPTLTSAPKADMIKTTDILAGMIEQEHEGADPAGIHIEGPFINPEKAGTQPRDCVYPFDPVFAAELIAAGRGRIKLMTFAPEIAHADQLIQLMLENGVIPSMGHSMASEKEVLNAIDAGARRCTHLFNGMPPLHQRRPDITLIALTDNRVSVEIIADGCHVHPRMVELASRVKPNDKLIGISNGVQASAEKRVVREDGAVVTSDGIIAGSATTLETGWLHFTRYSGMSDTLAAACFTSNPAHDLGLITRGEIKPGKKADITFLDVTTNKVRMTVIRGQVVYKAAE